MSEDASTDRSRGMGTDASAEDRRRAEIDVGVDAIARVMLAELTGRPDMDPFVRVLRSQPEAADSVRKGAGR